MKKRILIIEDDPQISALLQKYLHEEQFETATAMNGDNGLLLFNTEKFDVVILDIMLPGINGLQVCTKIREKSQVPILMLTALGTPENIAIGLDMGADDYLTKPFKFIELMARIRSLLRRSDHKEQADEIQYVFDDLIVNDEQKTVSRAGVQVQLTSTEYRLLLLFITNPLKVFSRLEILESVWGVDFDMGTNVVDVYINYLRKKLDVGDSKRLIHTVIGMGYALRNDK